MASGEGYRVDAAELARQAQDFPDLADRAQRIHQTLSQALDAAGECWGSDAAGQSFAAHHLGAANDTLDRLGSLSGRLSSVGQRWSETASGYRRVEADVVNTVEAAGVRQAEHE
ncbi:MAG TPA: hypothetical protein VG317_14000 [Pseudonocardiaceae bacterium]|jgi:uncharacterized protein YukE|nr:hypothetical protein [Pseudonocardiaceae bacterium]